MMGGRGHGFPEGIEKNYLTKLNKMRKIKHMTCIFYISDVNEKGESFCKFCGIGFNER